MKRWGRTPGTLIVNKLLIVSIAGLGGKILESRNRIRGYGPLPFKASLLFPPFPAVTCTAQATFRTASTSKTHGMVANGFYDRRWRKVHFWEQASSLVEGDRIWSGFRAAGRKVGLLFWQQAMGEDADLVLTPAPVHKHHGGMILDCYSQPAGLYSRLRRNLGEFPLRQYWGPFASSRVGDWIASATADVMRHEGPDLLLTYLPTLDYDLQRFGPDDLRSQAALEKVLEQLATLLGAAGRQGYEVVFWGDYAISACAGPAVFPNRALRTAGLFSVRTVHGRTYPDFNTSRVFAVCDHEVAHVYVRHVRDRAATRDFLAGLPGVSEVRDAQGDAHPNSGELVMTAESGRWLSYSWWNQDGEAPEYARHIDIHQKPGFDPCELFGQWFPPGVSQDTSRIRGTHGRTDSPVAWGGTLSFDPAPATLLELASGVRDWLNLHSTPTQGRILV